MRFGSVQFFKVLIKTVLAIAFFVPLILCIIFAVVLWNTNSELAALRQENQRITLAAEILTGERTGDVESFYEMYSKSGLSDDELIAYINSKNEEPEKSDGNDVPAATAPTEEESLPTMETVGLSSAETASAEAALPESEYAYIHEDMVVPAPGVTVREQGTVYLTFDDGPSDNTYSILSYLKKYNVKATFFVVPSRTEKCYELLQAIAADGHSIGVHSASHDYEKIYSSVEAFLEDFYEAWDIIYDATGIKTQIFRFPGGSKNDFNEATRDAIIEEMTRRGFRYFDWNVDSNDVGGATWTDMYNSVPADISQNYRSIVLMHDSEPRTNTVLVLEDILSVLVGEGYKLDKINNDTRPVQFIGPYA